MLPPNDDLESKTPEEPDLESLTPEEPDLESLTPEEPDLESLTPEELDLESLTPEELDLESLTPEELDLESLTPEELDLESLTPEELIHWAVDAFPRDLVFTTSLGAEDQMVLDLIAKSQASVEIVFLDTGRHFESTHELLEDSRQCYGLPIKVLFPNRQDLEALVSHRGPNFFYQSKKDRQQCCQVRKVDPLKRALAFKSAWITGLRQSQSTFRGQVSPFLYDEGYDLYKINPLWRLSRDEVWAYLHRNRVPYNSLHDDAYPSIGCAPCTRAVFPGDQERSGRWWWEEESQRECGLHLNLEGERHVSQ